MKDRKLKVNRADSIDATTSTLSVANVVATPKQNFSKPMNWLQRGFEGITSAIYLIINPNTWEIVH